MLVRRGRASGRRLWVVWCALVVVVVLNPTPTRGDEDVAEEEATAVAEKRSEAECLDLGFTAALRCSSCLKLATLVADADLTAECESCCREDEVKAASYAAARLEVDRTKVKFWPSVRHFLENDLASFSPALSVKHRTNHRPQLVLLDDAGATRDVVAIGTWAAETIVDFLRENLKTNTEKSDDDASGTSSKKAAATDASPAAPP